MSVAPSVSAEVLPTIARGGNARNRYIDYLRGVSILVVLLAHAPATLDELPVLGHFFGAIRQDAYYGVAMFFVISGFVITRRTIERYGEVGRISVRQFYAFRFSRIVPCLLLMLTLATLADRLHGVTDAAITRERIVYALTFRFNHYRMLHGASALEWDVLWSLSIEEVFYLIFPWFCRLGRKTSWIVGGLFAVGLTGPLLRADVNFGPWHWQAFSGPFGYLGCFDLIAIGSLTAFAVSRYQAALRDPAMARLIMLVGAVIAALVHAFLPAPNNLALGPTAIALGAALFLFAAGLANGSRETNSAASVLAFFGRHSYELYLFHGFVVVAILGARFGLGIISFRQDQLAWLIGISDFVFFAVSAGLAWTIAKYYSEPVRRKLNALL